MILHDAITTAEQVLLAALAWAAAAGVAATTVLGALAAGGVHLYRTRKSRP
ncbi:hypothetical protein [Streptomyces sp. NPDC060194]|uniref:hypothetical protein n=1 Tax=Streptomyces sp. NPDC060194 TaxID=3347069 RepID=UPI003665CDD6